MGCRVCPPCSGLTRLLDLAVMVLRPKAESKFFRARSGCAHMLTNIEGDKVLWGYGYAGHSNVNS